LQVVSHVPERTCRPHRGTRRVTRVCRSATSIVHGHSGASTGPKYPGAWGSSPSRAPSAHDRGGHLLADLPELLARPQLLRVEGTAVGPGDVDGHVEDHPA